MAKMTGTVPIPTPPAPAVSPETVAIGVPVSPIDRIKIMSASQWEELVLEWVDSLRQRYASVERCGGAGDMGRDVIAIEANGAWDNYQCKHYAVPLAPHHVWLELGKLVYYTHKGEFTCPRQYTFVAPRGAGTDLSNLLRRPAALRAGLLANWQSKCRDKITSTGPIDLSGALRIHFDAFDFSIIQALQPLRLIDEHAKTRWHVARFGGGLPARGPIPTPPAQPTQQEAGYVRCLLDAYGDYLQRAIAAPTDLEAEQILKEHFTDSRIEFYSAEALRSFSRDTLPPGEFEKLQDDVLSGVRDEIRKEHPNGYERLLVVVKTARALQLTGHALHTRLGVRDRGGICHQLANDARVRWTR